MSASFINLIPKFVAKETAQSRRPLHGVKSTLQTLHELYST